MRSTKVVLALVLILFVFPLLAAKTNFASFDNGLVLLDVNTTGANLNTFQVTNAEPNRSAVFLVYNDKVFNGQPVGTVLVWSFTEPPASTSALVPIPTIDNNGNPITWTLGTVTIKGQSFQSIVNPPWAFTMTN